MKAWRRWLKPPGVPVGASHGIALLAAAYFGAERLPAALSEIPIETVAAAGAWLGRRPEVRSGSPGRGGWAGAVRRDDLPGPVRSGGGYWAELRRMVRGRPQGGVADASGRSRWTLAGRPVPFVPPVPGVEFERTERGLRSVGIYAGPFDNGGTVEGLSTPPTTWRCPCSYAISAET